MTAAEALAALRRLIEGPGQRGVAPAILADQIIAVADPLTRHPDGEVAGLATRLIRAVRSAR